MPFYEITAERTYYGTFYVDAEGKDVAREDAHELADDFLNECEFETDISLREVDVIPAKSEWWTGGADGTWEYAHSAVTESTQTGPLPQCEGQETFDV